MSELPVHPHACGERIFLDVTVRTDTGSSPRMWGTHVAFWAIFTTGRFIPTHVGNAFTEHCVIIGLAVHPHACGERRNVWSAVLPASGSSPRMWGTRSQLLAENEQMRFIPTHVGNAVCYFWPRQSQSVHPHACGERIGYVRLPARSRRFIPTHVGNAGLPKTPNGRTTVHPHACGERDGCSAGRATNIGSSPRMWGTLICV